jgi:hypothetical protein
LGGPNPFVFKEVYPTTDDDFTWLKVAFRVFPNTVGVSRQLMALRPVYLASELKDCATSGLEVAQIRRHATY